MKHTYNRLRDKLNIHPKHMTLNLTDKELRINLTNSSHVVYNASHLRWFYVTNSGTKSEKQHKYVGTHNAFFEWVKAKLNGRPLL